MRLDRLLGGEGPAAAGREPVGDGQQGDVGGDRLGRPQVLVDAARRQRRLVDEEAEAQVVQGQRLQVAGSARGSPAAARRCPPTISAPVAVVADEGDVAVAARRGSPACRCRAGARRSAAPCRGVISSASGSSSSAAYLGGALAGEPLEVGLDLERALQHRQRVAVDVEVVVGALFDARAAPPARAARPRSGRARRAARARAAGRARRAAGAARRAGARRPARRRAALRRGRAARSRGRPRARARPRAARRRSSRSGSAAKLRSPTTRSTPAVEVGEAAEGVDRLAAGERHRDRADREVARGQVGLDRPAAQRRHVDLPGAVGGRRRARSRTRPRARRRARRPRGRSPWPRPRGRRRPRGRGRSPRARAPRRAPRRRRSRPPRLAQRLAAPDATSGAAARRSRDAHAASRGTRAEIPQVIS